MEEAMDYFGGVGATVNVIRQPGDLFAHDFTGTIKETHGEFITVADQDDERWDCDPAQLEHNSDDFVHE